MCNSEDRFNQARRYHGRHESRDVITLTGLLGFNPTKTAWCAGFINAIEKSLGREGTGSLLARSYLNYGETVTKPQEGDIVILKRGLLPWQGHVGLYASEEGDKILLLGGNQNNKVCYKYYPKKKVLGYRR